MLLCYSGLSNFCSLSHLHKPFNRLRFKIQTTRFATKKNFTLIRAMHAFKNIVIPIMIFSFSTIHSCTVNWCRENTTLIGESHVMGP